MVRWNDDERRIRYLLGIGTLYPQEMLHVNGNAIIYGNLKVSGVIEVPPPPERQELNVNADIRVLDAGRPIIDLHRHGGAHFGGNNKAGYIWLFRTEGDNKSLDQATIQVNGQEGDFIAGGHGRDGDIVLRSGDARNRIRLSGRSGNVWLGGNGADGDIWLFRTEGDNLTADQATIHLNGQDGNIRATEFNTSGGDCAEDFDVVESEQIEPGTVLVVDQEDTLQRSNKAYDNRVVGVVSGAGNCKPGIILDKKHSQNNRVPVALTGKVYCKVDADYSPIEVGDLLTTSSTPGHAMKADNPLKAFGAVIGKALRPLKEGKGLIPILVALQ